MKLLPVGNYQVKEPLFEGARIILSGMGESYTPAYIQGISGAAFKIAGGCPSRPTCIYMMWTPDFIKYLGYEIYEYPINEDGPDSMIKAVIAAVDAGKPALVWNALTNAEWDIVCGYDEETKEFLGKGSYRGFDNCEREPWGRAAEWPFGAIIIGEKINSFDARRAEIVSLKEAVLHARKSNPPEDIIEGIEFYKHWAEDYADGTRERDVADAYCHDIYSSSRKFAAEYLNEIALNHGDDVGKKLREAAEFFNAESAELDRAGEYLSWSSPWGIDENRNKNLPPILEKAAMNYEKAIECIEAALALLP